MKFPWSPTEGGKNQKRVNADPLDFPQKQILQWVFVSSYLDKKEVLPKYHYFM